MHVHNASATNKRRMGGKKPHAQDVEFEVNLCDVYAMTLALSSWSTWHTHTRCAHTNITPSMSRAALRWTRPPQSLTSPSCAISFVFGQMQCSGPGGSNTVWSYYSKTISHNPLWFHVFSLVCTSTASLDLSTAGWLLLNLQVFF